MSLESEASFAQFHEDADLRRLLGKRGTGTCVEVGANDGIADSNTYLFESLGWTCILVEPNPELCAVLRRVRRAQVFQCAASDTAGEIVLHLARGAARAHGVSAVGPAGERHVRNFGFIPEPVVVATRTLNDILEEAGVSPPLDFVTIDVEGHELAVLDGFELERWNPRILIIEDNSRFVDTTIRAHLARRGFVPFRRTGVNDWYARRTDCELVTTRSRMGYSLQRVLARGRGFLARFPGLGSAVRFARRRTL